MQHRLAIDAAGDVLERVAHEQGGNAARVLDVLDAAIGAATRFGERLAVLARHARANAIEIFFDQLAVTKEQSRPLDRRRVAPFWKSIGGGFDGKIDVFLRARRDFGDDFAARRIEDGSVIDAADFAPSAVDKSGNGSHA